MSNGWNGGKLSKTVSEIWSAAWRLIVVLIVAAVGWYWLAQAAANVRLKDPAQTISGPNSADVEMGRDWAVKLLGLAGSLAGFLGLASAAARDDLKARSRLTTGGTTGVLAGATFLGVGGTAVPVALGVYLTGAVLVRAVAAWKHPPQYDEV